MLELNKFQLRCLKNTPLHLNHLVLTVWDMLHMLILGKVCLKLEFLKKTFFQML